MTSNELVALLRDHLSDAIPEFYLDKTEQGNVVIVTSLIEDEDTEELIPSDEVDMESEPDFESVNLIKDLDKLSEIDE